MSDDNIEFEDEEEYLPDENPPCPKCHGSGHTIEGFDCEYCDGTGELEI